MNRLEFYDALDYAKQHGDVIKDDRYNYMFKLHTEMKMFKKSGEGKIINLLVPAVALLHIGPGTGATKYKCRVDQAHCHSIWSGITRRGRWEEWAKSHFCYGFLYEAGKPVDLDYFENELETCAAGIHCFADIETAKRYRFN